MWRRTNQWQGYIYSKIYSPRGRGNKKIYVWGNKIKKRRKEKKKKLKEKGEKENKEGKMLKYGPLVHIFSPQEQNWQFPHFRENLEKSALKMHLEGSKIEKFSAEG